MILLNCTQAKMGEERLAREILGQNKSVRLVVFSPIIDERPLRAMLEPGVAGYLLKTESPEAILICLRAAVSGELCFSAPVKGLIARWQPESSDSETLKLNEHEVIGLDLLSQAKLLPAIPLFVKVQVLRFEL